MNIRKELAETVRMIPQERRSAFIAHLIDDGIMKISGIDLIHKFTRFLYTNTEIYVKVLELIYPGIADDFFEDAIYHLIYEKDEKIVEAVSTFKF